MSPRARALVVAIVSSLAAPALAQPEARGPHPIADYDAGRPMLAGVAIPVRVYHPTDVTTPMPVVAVVHGFLRNGTFMAELARTLASRGMVALVPDMPCGLSGCDHDANGDQIRALIAWGVAESGRAGSPLVGRVDATKRGAIGHSWGALATILASTQADGFEVAVLLDPNDDRGVAAMRAPTVTKPTLLLTAEVLGNCNNAWGAGVFDTIPPPHMRARVLGSAHCDAEEPSDSLCPIGCGRGDPSKSVVFRRYAVAFVSCALQGDPAVAPWVDGAMLAMDAAGGTVDRVAAAGLGALACRGGVAPVDGGVAEDSGAVVREDGAVADDASSEDARPSADDAAAQGHDDAAPVVGAPDAGAGLDAAAGPGPADASTLMPASSDGCQAVSPLRDPLPLLVLLALAGLASRRRRR